MKMRVPFFEDKLTISRYSKYLQGHRIKEDYNRPLPIQYIRPIDLPDNFSWGNVSGASYLTKSLNQHLPQWCGSCWAHGALSSLADRIKIARNAEGDDINLSIQFILNCGGEIAGSCLGGSHIGVYEFIKKTGFVPVDTCMPYLACSSDSNEGFCPHVDTTCSAINTCRTCNTFVEKNGFCAQIDVFPNATVSEYGTIELDPEAVMAEIYARGPVATEVAGEPLHNYTGGVFADEAATRVTTHIVSIVGWGSYDAGKYWIIRNSWVRAACCNLLLNSRSIFAWTNLLCKIGRILGRTRILQDKDGKQYSRSREESCVGNTW
jgi:cathepsin X